VKRVSTPPIALSLSVQYVAAAPELPRATLRRWVNRALRDAAQDAQCPPLQRATLAIRLVDEAEGRQLNHDFRGKPYATNVLTFAYGVDDDGGLSADLVLCLPVLRREAQAQNKTVAHHAAHLTVHGVLHALGYDHEDDVQTVIMQSLETRILRAMGIADPY